MRAQLVAAIVVCLLIVSLSTGFAQGWDDSGYLWDARSVKATSTQSWFGGTGMIVIPTAHTAAQKQINAHYHVIDLEESDDWEPVWGLTAGIYPGIEAGVTNLSEGWTGDDDELLYQAKIGANLDDLLRLGPESPDIAFGGRDLTDEIGETYYVVFSKDFELDEYQGETVGVSLGLGNADGDDVPLDGFFAGVDLTPFDFARLQVEHDGENINAALRYWWSEWAVTEVGVLDGDVGFGATLHTGW